MRKPTENFDCAEFKLSLIKEIIQFDCNDVLETIEIPLLHPVFNFKLSEDQARCMNNEAARVLNKPSLRNFVIRTPSFKTIPLDYNNVHFVFIDRNSLNNYTTVSIPDFEHDLYFMIICCDAASLTSFDFSNYNAYVVNANFEAEPIELSLDTYKDFRREFLTGVGVDIRNASTLNGVTEYMTYTRKKVDDFRAVLIDDTDFNIKLICIKNSCDIGTSDIAVSTFLRDDRNQDRLTMAFQKFDAGINTNFYDIGNMHP